MRDMQRGHIISLYHDMPQSIWMGRPVHIIPHRFFILVDPTQKSNTRNLVVPRLSTFLGRIWQKDFSTIHRRTYFNLLTSNVRGC
jgi:hypothetical protein